MNLVREASGPQPTISPPESLQRALFWSHESLAILGGGILILTLGLTLWLGENAQELATKSGPAAHHSLRALNGLHHSMAALEGLLSQRHAESRQEWEDSWIQEIRPASQELRSVLIQEKAPQAQLHQLVPLLDEVEEIQWTIQDMAQALGNEHAQSFVRDEIQRYQYEVLHALTTLIDTEKQRPPDGPGGKQIVGLLADMRASFLVASTYFERFLESASSANEQEYQRQWDVFQDRLASLEAHPSWLTQEERGVMPWIHTQSRILHTLVTKAFALRKRQDWNMASHLFSTRLVPVVENAQRLLHTIVATHETRMHRDADMVTSLHTVILWLAPLFVIGLIVAAKLISRAHARRIAAPIVQLARAAKEMTTAHRTERLPVTRSDEIGQLTQQFNVMRDTLIKSEKSLLEANKNLDSDVQARTKVLAQKEAQLRLLLDSTAEAIYGFDLERNCMFCNPACLRMLGYTDQNALLGHNLHHLIHPRYLNGAAYPEKVGPAYLALAESREVHVPEEWVWRADGTVFPAEYWIHPIWEEKRLKGGVATFVDITDRKAAEAKIRQRESQLRAIVDSTQDAIITVDAHGQILFWNEGACQLLGYTAQEMQGQGLTRIIPEQFQHAHAEGFEQAVNAERLVHRSGIAEVMARKKDGEEISVQISLSVWKEGDATRVTGILHDITDRKALEVQLRHSHKMEAIGTLAGGIAHDFNNILTAILGYAELAKIGAAPGSTLSRHLKEIYQGGQRAKDLVNQILVFSRSQLTEHEVFELGAVVQEVVRFLHGILPATLTIRQHITTRALILGNPSQIHQILMNLATNAEHAMRHQDEQLLEIGVAEEQVDADMASIYSALNPGPHLRLWVRDSGSGIPPEIQAHIFDPFFTTKHPGEGTGMGLAVVHGLIQSHHGLIMVDSTPGNGTTLTMYFPQSQEVMPTLPSEDAHPVPGGTERILFLDDDPAIATLGEDWFTALGYTVVVMTDSQQALAVFRDNPQAFDLVVTDQTMPHMTGDRLARALLRIRPTLPIILCTGYSATLSADTAYELGIAAFVLKPVDWEDLARTVRQILDKTKTVPHTEKAAWPGG